MKTKFIFLLAAILVGVLPTASAALNYSQNFDGMGTAGTTAPAGWSEMYITGDSTSVTLPTSAEMATALIGSGASLAVWNQTDPSSTFFLQAANEGATSSSANRLLGTSPTAVRGEILDLMLVNSSGGPLTSIHLSYDMQVMALGTIKLDGLPPDELPGYRFYFLDGSTWTRFSGLDLSNDTLNSVGHASGDFSFTTPVPDGGTMEFRWYDDNADSFSPDDMIAIDNVVVTPEPTTLSLLAVGALAMILRRRKA